MTRPDRYSSNQLLAHWLIVLLVVFQFLTGGGMAEAFDAALLSGNRVVTGTAIVHGWFGLTILGVMLWRLSLRRNHGAPPPPETEPKPVQYLSRGVHYAFYVVLIAMPIAGLAAVVTGTAWLADAHALTSRALLALAALHVVGAAWHAIKGDGVIRRMLRQDPARQR